MQPAAREGARADLYLRVALLPVGGRGDVGLGRHGVELTWGEAPHVGPRDGKQGVPGM